ncbi:dTDP-Rha:alpha-D-GlcNAc-pyrophosphate polyprenol, alpha-3-L-rhamnosyltransferase [Fusobacterium necrogenes]|uniref:dTDP-Rha:alpha-D-GlcNAc-pyrophosphate polyprenol, alpha-3-L-rhamnosyltransferase n=1 Tax=Fusobacterium necrogenes TaxID=858 RepID=A0A377H0B1_9FUSO|nr:glycosyltransferase family 2 protein [Fusobacterium necrogenes]STO32264.1 dTDP-Rha:alpha-D-GlcNAc-pyrophosphate polyprenol, alpha-3-L-rhamnosyltransferase [Fusobacterium necrogenes]
MKITGSIVTYNNNIEELRKAISSFLNTNLDIKLYISDNSEIDTIKEICRDQRIEYIFNNSNKGFGYGHNIAIKKAEKENSKYHFVINPDIYYEEGQLEKMVDFLEKNENVALMMPKILHLNGEIQYACKLLPTPFNLFSRAFLPSWKWVKKINDNYEMRFTNYDKTIEVPYISGCFMGFRTSVFKEIGYFDDNIFMYLEETDISRRISIKGYKTVMYPETQIFHKWERGTYKSKKLRNITIQSSIYYFNKYGWFFDRYRREINKRIKNRYQ